MVIIPLMLTNTAHASEASYVELMHVETSSKTRVPFSSGWGTYMNYCSGCHELGYARYARTAEDLELDAELVEANMIFDGTSIGELMTNAMSDDDSKCGLVQRPQTSRLSVVFASPTGFTRT